MRWLKTSVQHHRVGLSSHDRCVNAELFLNISEIV